MKMLVNFVDIIYCYKTVDTVFIEVYRNEYWTYIFSCVIPCYFLGCKCVVSGTYQST